MSTAISNDPKRVNFIRRGYTQVLVISIVCFCCPGFFNALTGLGGAGSNNPSTNAASNAILYACFALFGYFGGAFFNLLGPRVLMALGGLTYAFYSGAKYLEGQYPSLNWLFLVSGGVLGIGAAFLWCAQGSLMLAYAPKARLGFYIATFWTIFNIGGLVGGFIQFGMNYNNVTEGSASAVSYFTFIGVMIAGAVVAALFLVDPATVVKEDGSEVVVEAPKGPKEEFRDVLSVILDKNMLLLFMLFFGSNFFYTYVFNGVNGFIFTLRTRGLNSALYWASQMVGAVVIGRLLDNANQPARKRAFMGFLILAVFMNLVYALGCYLEYGYLAGYNKSIPIHTVFRVDFKDWDYWYPAVVFILYGLGDAMIQAYSYWVMGAIAGDNTALCAKYTGFYKSVQSVGACISFVLDIEWFGIPYVYQFWCCWILFLAALPTTYMAIRGIPSDEVKAEKLAESPAASTPAPLTAAEQ